MSKIPQRVKEPSSYARIFAKHKANQPKKEEIHETQEPEKSTHEGPLRTNVNAGGPLGTSGVPPGAPVARAPMHGVSNYQGKRKLNLGCTGVQRDVRSRGAPVNFLTATRGSGAVDLCCKVPVLLTTKM